MGKIMAVLTVIAVFGLLIYKNFFYYDEAYGCAIKVIPSIQPSNWDFHRVLDLVKNTSPDDYKYMCANVTTISKDISCGGFDGGCFYTNNKKTIFVGNDQNNLAVAASIVIHELCHVRQFNEGRDLNEQECYRAGSTYLSSLYSY